MENPDSIDWSKKKYLPLEVAANQLGITTEQLLALKNRGDIRGFADRGAWKFKSEDLDVLAIVFGTVEVPHQLDIENAAASASDSDVDLVSEETREDTLQALGGDDEVAMVVGSVSNRLLDRKRKQHEYKGDTTTAEDSGISLDSGISSLLDSDVVGMQQMMNDSGISLNGSPVDDEKDEDDEGIDLNRYEDDEDDDLFEDEEVDDEDRSVSDHPEDVIVQVREGAENLIDTPTDTARAASERAERARRRRIGKRERNQRREVVAQEVEEIVRTKMASAGDSMRNAVAERQANHSRGTRLISKEGGSLHHAKWGIPFRWLRSQWDNLSRGKKVAIGAAGALASAVVFAETLGPSIATGVAIENFPVGQTGLAMGAATLALWGPRLLSAFIRRRWGNDFDNALNSTMDGNEDENVVRSAARQTIKEIQAMDDRELTQSNMGGAIRDSLHLLNKADLINSGNISAGLNEAHCAEQCFNRIVRISEISDMILSIGWNNFQSMSLSQKETSIATHLCRARNKPSLSSSERNEAAVIAKQWHEIQRKKLSDDEVKRLLDRLDKLSPSVANTKEWRQKLLMISAEAGQEIQNKHRKRITQSTSAVLAGAPPAILFAGGLSAWPFALGSAVVAGGYAGSRYAWRLYKRHGQLDEEANFQDSKQKVKQDKDAILGAAKSAGKKTWAGAKATHSKLSSLRNRNGVGEADATGVLEGNEPIPKIVTQVDIDREHRRLNTCGEEYRILFKTEGRSDPDVMDLKRKNERISQRLSDLQAQFKAQEELAKKGSTPKKVAKWMGKNMSMPAGAGGVAWWALNWKFGLAIGGVWAAFNIKNAILGKKDKKK